MNLGASAIVLRPRTLAEILDLACRLSMSLALGLYARLAALVLLPIYAGCLALRFALGWHWAAVWAIALLAGTFVQGIFTVGVGRLLFSETLGARQVVGFFARRFRSYLGMQILSRAVLGIAALPMLLGLPFAWPRVAFAYEACLLEGAGAVPALQRGSRFVDGRSLSVFGVMLSILLTQAGILVVMELLCQGLVAEVLQLGKPFGALFSDGGSPFALAGLLLSYPYAATARFLHYIDARTRSDGWDVQLRFMAIAVAEGERRHAA